MNLKDYILNSAEHIEQAKVQKAHIQEVVRLVKKYKERIKLTNHN